MGSEGRYAIKPHSWDNRLHHPLHALSIALRRATALPMPRRIRLLAACRAATDVAGLRTLVQTLPAGDRDEVCDILAPPGLPVPTGWEAVALLGRGGMGEAWLCSAANGDLAVLKMLRPELRNLSHAEARFRREIAATVDLRHPNVVAALAADIEAGWMLLEFVAGGDLRAAVRVAGQLSEADALAVAAQVAEGLAAFAAAGLVHRDLKPSNLFVTPDGIVRIADLGLACRASPERTRLTTPGRTVGSWSFMSPEQLASDGDIDHRSDYFSLGATIVALCAGRNPGGQREGTLTLATAVRLIRPSPALRDLLARLLQPDRAYRPANPDELRAIIAVAASAVGSQGSVPSLELRSTAASLDPAGESSSGLTTLNLPANANATATDASPMTDDRILLGSARSPARWMVWATSRLILGKLRGGDVDLALRNYPVEAHRDALEELSRRHLEIVGSPGTELEFAL